MLTRRKQLQASNISKQESTAQCDDAIEISDGDEEDQEEVGGFILVGQYVPREELLKDAVLDDIDFVHGLDLDFEMRSEGEESDLNITISSQNEEIDGDDHFGIQTSNCTENRLRRMIGKPVKYWENERPLPIDTKKKKQSSHERKRKLDMSVEEPRRRKLFIQQLTSVKLHTLNSSRMVMMLMKILMEILMRILKILHNFQSKETRSSTK
ncbi:predicted protein [Naegleria gruberi]|uniref:Predicted protein n=1 Tax=Naegleria gruberi TaxID=5762 RepID=D2VYK6_NAEGR|nr:uncharacterized protein NAEGRDRAFT_53283 [Naegleria gruberi]EFC38130.1 predicted protein [Naegleria gruberi]|eukprot:XP_002670874.1 predicted protein [Naegleria gruberi strain NEG-M]